jgi:hypothetical protein
MAVATVNLCAVATQRYFEKSRWLNLWTALIWFFGATVILFSGVAVLLFIRQTWLPGGLTVLGTVVNGAGIRWVVTQRNGAEAEEREAYKTFTEACAEKPGGLSLQSDVPSAEQLRSMAWRSLFRSR